MVAVLVVNWNSYQDTIECLKSLYTSAYPEFQIIVLDNGSQDMSVKEIQLSLGGQFLASNQQSGYKQKVVAGKYDLGVHSFGSSAFLLSSAVNYGFCSGCNLAIDFLYENGIEFDYVFLLNNDAIIEPCCIKELVSMADKEGKPSVIGALVKNIESGETLFAGAWFPRELFATSMIAITNDHPDGWDADRVEGSAMLVSRKLLEERRSERECYFDPDLFMYGEDAELCFYAKSKGYHVMMAGKAIVYHKLSHSSGGGGSALSYYYITRNRIRLASKCLPAWAKILFHAWYPVTRVARALQRKVQGKPETAMAILNGLWDGYSGKAGKWDRHTG